jgi:TRAP-type C4-dicarboxylate transport system permease large subunit
VLIDDFDPICVGALGLFSGTVGLAGFPICVHIFAARTIWRIAHQELMRVSRPQPQLGAPVLILFTLLPDIAVMILRREFR